MKIWPQSTIRELLALAETIGEARATLDSPEDAERFRFAIYTFRRAKKFGNNTTVRISGNSVIIERKPEIRIATPFSEEREPANV